MKPLLACKRPVVFSWHRHSIGNVPFVQKNMKNAIFVFLAFHFDVVRCLGNSILKSYVLFVFFVDSLFNLWACENVKAKRKQGKRTARGYNHSATHRLFDESSLAQTTLETRPLCPQRTVHRGRLHSGARRPCQIPAPRSFKSTLFSRRAGLRFETCPPKVLSTVKIDVTYLFVVCDRALGSLLSFRLQCTPPPPHPLRPQHTSIDHTHVDAHTHEVD